MELASETAKGDPSVTRAPKSIKNLNQMNFIMVEEAHQSVKQLSEEWNIVN
jgi:hypothetical protein